MNKMDEINLRGGYVLKSYTDDSIKGILDLLEKVQSKITIESITVNENVEYDMKSIDGTDYSVQEFRDNYRLIKHQGKELSYRIKGTYNGASVSIGIGENNNVITLMTNTAGLELDDIIAPAVIETLDL
jgi:hypothetical protein